MIVFDEVNKSYREGGVTRPVLSAVSFEIDKGEFVAIQGPSGSGKSTLLNLMAGLDVPDSGTILIDGQRISSMNEHRRTLFRRRNIGFVFQAYNLIPTLSVAENIGFSIELNHLESDFSGRVSELLEQIGLADRGNSYPDHLSGGEQQRVAIARAIAHMPRLVLADEPTGNLDIQAEKTVMNLMSRLHRKHETTLVVATHSTEVASQANRTLHLQTQKDS
ncbi:MAG: ABC transporter ATP-binding protein [Arenicellales bacterium]|nr:ABC transporter ATP-binding protein [Arenicellales bacterium]